MDPNADPEPLRLLRSTIDRPNTLEDEDETNNYIDEVYEEEIVPSNKLTFEWLTFRQTVYVVIAWITLSIIISGIVIAGWLTHNNSLFNIASIIYSLCVVPILCFDFLIAKNYNYRKGIISLIEMSSLFITLISVLASVMFGFMGAFLEDSFIYIAIAFIGMSFISVSLGLLFSSINIRKHNKSEPE